MPKKQTPESAVLKAVLAYLSVHPRVARVWRINTRVVDVVGRGGRMRPMVTAPSGHPDIAGYMKDGRALYVECKSARGRLTGAQLDWITHAANHGCVAFVARSIDDARQALDAP